MRSVDGTRAPTSYLGAHSRTGPIHAMEFQEMTLWVCGVNKKKGLTRGTHIEAVVVTLPTLIRDIPSFDRLDVFQISWSSGKYKISQVS